jgi:hypothetical protein
VSQPDTGLTALDGGDVPGFRVDLHDLALGRVRAIAVVQGHTPIGVGIQALLEQADLVVLRVEVDRVLGGGDCLLLGHLVADGAAALRDEERDDEDAEEEGDSEDPAVPKRARCAGVGRQRSLGERDSQGSG